MLSILSHSSSRWAERPLAVKAIYDCLKHLKDGGAIEELADQQASSALLRSVNRTEEFVRWQQEFLRA